jgi:hypothetical protein
VKSKPPAQVDPASGDARRDAASTQRAAPLG